MNVKFSGIAWQGNEGFYYSSYDKPEEGSRLSGMTDQHKLFYHRLGTPQSDDRLVFRSEEHTSELQSLMRISYAVFCLKKKKKKVNKNKNKQNKTTRLENRHYLQQREAQRSKCCA